MPDSILFRHSFQALEMFADQAGETRKISGIAAVFDQESIRGEGSMWAYRIVVRRGSFKKTLKESDQVMLWSHNADFPMARKSAKTLSLKEEKEGLYFEAELGNQSWALDAWESINRKDVQGVSIGFQIVKDSWPKNSEEEKDKIPLQEIQEIKLFEVSPVVFPQFASTSVEAEKQIAMARWTIEAAIKDGRLSRDPDSQGTTPEPDIHSVAGDAQDQERIRIEAASRLRTLQLREWRLRNGLFH